MGPMTEALRQVQDGVASAWCQRAYDGPGGSHCLVGWVYTTAEPLGITTTASFLYECLRDYCKSPSLSSFNDDSSQEGVLLFLDEAITAAEDLGL